MRWPRLSRAPRPEYGGFALARHLSAGVNRTFSPLSAEIALRMLLFGLRGETARQVQSLLDPEGWDESAFEDLSKERDLRLANGVWLCDRFQSDSSYGTMLMERFGARAVQIDGNPVPTVNEWVEARTEGRISRLLDRVDPDWCVILAGAFHYKGAWRKPFSPRSTHPRTFHGASGSREVPMMNDTDWMGVCQSEGSIGVERPLDGDFTFLAILPRTGSDAWTWLVEGGPTRILESLETIADRKVVLAIPKFAASNRFDLTDPLRRTGANLLFEDGDFSGMGSFPQPPHLDRMVQATTFRIDESGVEASATTGVALAAASSARPIEITFDRPFAYALVHRTTRTILMIGVCDDPTH